MDKIERMVSKGQFVQLPHSIAKGEGQTTLVDSRMALKLAGQQQVNRWKNIDVTLRN
jgi:hypothetical protein